MTEVVTGMMDLLNVPIFTASDCHESISLYATHQQEIGLVILDSLVPEMSVEEILERLKEINPDAPVLLSSIFDAERLAAAHGVSALQKPYKIKQLEQVVKKYLTD